MAALEFVQLLSIALKPFSVEIRPMTFLLLPWISTSQGTFMFKHQPTFRESKFLSHSVAVEGTHL